MDIKNKYRLTEIVYVMTDHDQLERFVTEIIITINGMMYGIKYIDTVSYHYEFELSNTKNVVAGFN